MLTHRRQEKELSNGWVMLFADNEANDHYGNHVWELKTELPHVGTDPRVVAFAAEFYGCDEDEAQELVNPSDIIESAGAWDDPQFVSDIWQELEIVGVATDNGAVVLDRESIDLEYSVDSE